METVFEIVLYPHGTRVGSGHKVLGTVTHRIQFFCREDLPIRPNTYPLDTGPSPSNGRARHKRGYTNTSILLLCPD
ncbi:Uncharacterized protein APZ42_007582 [Daphnia magna]|uniref:Uncharacterized protein n=1 Tax=Daphnia magna TaxID=35525 RepID=A0A164F7K2_9CRUS|nr:Uncharacterized protein APZ42_007582 [Daphnia magna]